MRLWTLHPQYLDAKGLVALWREGLLAKKVLEGNTKGYLNHPQLIRFKEQKNPLNSINEYLHFVCDEAQNRGYNFDRKKLHNCKKSLTKIPVNTGQIKYEWEHLLNKLKKRDRKKYLENKKLIRPKTHSLFKLNPGGVEKWEIITQ